MEITDDQFFSLVRENKTNLKSFADWYGIDNKGTKIQLIERLYVYKWGVNPNNLISKSRKIINLESSTQKFEPRPLGSRIKLGKLKKIEFESILGMKVNPSSKIFKSLQKLIPQDEVSSLVKCRKGTEKINRSICEWCLYSNECDDNDAAKIKENSRYIFLQSKSGAKSAIKDDKLLITSFMDKKDFVVDYNSNIVNLIFSSRTDAFKPMFGRKSKRQMFITPASFCTISNQSKNGSHFSHIFYSSLLGRSITIFEAIVLDKLSDSDFSDKSSSPSFEHTYNWFETRLGFSESQNLVSKLKKMIQFVNRNFLESYNPNTQPGISGYDNSALFHDIFSKGREMFRYNLIDISAELFSCFVEGSSFEEQVYNFFNEIYSKLYTLEKFDSGKIKRGGNKIIDSRIDCILLHPSDKTENVKLIGKYRLIRKIPIKNLSEPYLIIDGLPVELNHNEASENESISMNIFEQSSNAFRTCDMLNKSKYHLDPIYFCPWNETKNEELDSLTNLVMLFDGNSINEAHSMNLFLENLNTMKGDRNYFVKIDNFNLFIETFFEISYSLNDSPSSEMSSFLEIREEVMNPRIKKQSTYDKILHLSELFPNYVSRMEDPDGDDIAKGRDTEQITIHNSRFALILRRHKVDNTQYGAEDNFGHMSDFYIVENGDLYEGFVHLKKAELPSKLETMLLFSLNGDSNQELIKIPHTCVYISIELERKLNDLYTKKSGRKEIRKFVKIINSFSSNSVTFFHLGCELEKSPHLNDKKFLHAFLLSDFEVLCHSLPNPVGNFSDIAFFSGKKLDL